MQEKEFTARALATARDAAIDDPAYRFTAVKLALEVDKGVEHFSPYYRKLVDSLQVLEKKGALIETGQKVVKMGGIRCWVNEYVFRDVHHPDVLAYIGIQSPEIDRQQRELDLLQRATAAAEIQAGEAQRQSKLAHKQAKMGLWWSAIGIAIATVSLIVSIAK